jgi:L-fuculose-phosphate aldolase
MDERQQRDEIVRLGKLLHQRGYVAATDGNLSVRLDDDRILATPTGMSKGLLTADDLVVVDSNGRKLSGERGASSELEMHLLVYRLRPDVHAVVHAHPPTATGFAAAGLSLEEPLISEVVIALGSVPLAPYATPGTPELTKVLEPLVPRYDAILMANHGAVTCGPDLLSAYMKMETVEHSARIALVTHQLGQQHLLGTAEVQKLLAIRRHYAGASPLDVVPPPTDGVIYKHRPLRSLRQALHEVKELVFSAFALTAASMRMLLHVRRS